MTPLKIFRTGLELAHGVAIPCDENHQKMLAHKCLTVTKGYAILFVNNSKRSSRSILEVFGKN